MDINDERIINSNGKFKTVNLKLPIELKSKFLQITHERHTTMQDVLSAFISSYTDHPEKFQIKMEVL